jgi:hypothetical protein
MIRIANGSDVRALLNRVARRPDRFIEIIVCSPFMDPPMLTILANLNSAMESNRCALRVITSPAVALQLRQQFPNNPRNWSRLVSTPDALHAKVYVALARRRDESEVIVTSANLTCAGLGANIELGVRALPTSDPGRSLLDQVYQFVRRLAA